MSDCTACGECGQSLMDVNDVFVSGPMKPYQLRGYKLQLDGEILLEGKFETNRIEAREKLSERLYRSLKQTSFTIQVSPSVDRSFHK